MTERRRFEVVAPDWGEAHLTPEAVVAYVDGELAAGPHERATRHLGRCTECAAEVIDQRQARTALRGAGCPSLPSSLMSSLCAIPQSAELPATPAGLSVDADGEFVTLQRPVGATRASRRSRRMRLGAGAAVSGLAIGALAFGVPASGSLPDPGAGPTASFGPGAVPVARFAATPVPNPNPAPAPPGPGAPRSTMLNASLPTDGR